MPKATATRRTPPQDEPAAASPAVYAPLKPRRTLFVVLSIVFAAWVAFLTVLYFTTVRGRVDPHDHKGDVTTDAGWRHLNINAGPRIG